VLLFLHTHTHRYTYTYSAHCKTAIRSEKMNCENLHPNLTSASPATTDSWGLKYDIVSPPNRLSTLSSRFSAYSMLDESYYTVGEASQSGSLRSGQKDFAVSDVHGLSTLSKLQSELMTTSLQLQDREEKLQELQEQHQLLQAHSTSVQNQCDMLQSELESNHFFIELQGQKIAELDNFVSSTRLEYHENIASKNKKLRVLSKKLERDKEEHEKRANMMICQLNEQMTALQKMAMTRIESLEKELMKQRHRTQELESENKELREENDEREYTIFLLCISTDQR
jgi:chromosome segregation ATPase